MTSTSRAALPSMIAREVYAIEPRLAVAATTTAPSSRMSSVRRERLLRIMEKTEDGRRATAHIGSAEGMSDELPAWWSACPLRAEIRASVLADSARPDQLGT